jgi:hypothetical protein
LQKILSVFINHSKHRISEIAYYASNIPHPESIIEICPINLLDFGVSKRYTYFVFTIRLAKREFQLPPIGVP